jgi:hypothetical protein
MVFEVDVEAGYSSAFDIEDAAARAKSDFSSQDARNRQGSRDRR